MMRNNTTRTNRPVAPWAVSAARRSARFALALICTFVAGCRLTGPATQYVPVYKTDKPAVIDGRLDEPFWRQAVPVQIDWRFITGGGVRAPQPLGYAKMAWDEHYLYVGYEVRDTDLRAATSGETGGKDHSRMAPVIGGTWDVVEVFISPHDDPEHFWELHHNALNHFSDIYIIMPSDPDSPLARGLNVDIRFIVRDDIDAGRSEEDVDFTPASAVTLMPAKAAAGGQVRPSTVNDSSDTDGGWIGEIRVPWGGIGAARALLDRKNKVWNMDGQTLRSLHVIQNGGASENYHDTLFHTSPTMPAGWFHKGYPHWPAYRFVAKPPAK